MRLPALNSRPVTATVLAATSGPTGPLSIAVLVRGVAVIAAVALAIGIALTWRIGGGIQWSAAVFELLPFLLVLGAASQAWRFLRWHLLVRRRVPTLPLTASIRIYLAGFALELSPGRLAAFLKFALVRQSTGVAEAETVGVLPVEAATEVLSYLVLSVGAALLGGYRLPPIGWGAVVAFLGLFVLALLSPSRAWLHRRLGRLTPVHGERWLRAFLHGLVAIGGPLPVLLALACALAARVCEVVLFQLAAGAVGLPLSLIGAALAWGASGLAGGLSMLPGGVGAAEGAIVATVLAIGGNGAPALAAALLSRAVTLWFWIPFGLACAVVSTRRTGSTDVAYPAPKTEDRRTAPDWRRRRRA